MVAHRRRFGRLVSSDSATKGSSPKHPSQPLRHQDLAGSNRCLQSSCNCWLAWCHILGSIPEVNKMSLSSYIEYKPCQLAVAGVFAERQGANWRRSQTAPKRWDIVEMPKCKPAGQTYRRDRVVFGRNEAIRRQRCRRISCDLYKEQLANDRAMRVGRFLCYLPK